MTPEQIAAIKTNWEKVAPIADQAATIFYDKLFTLKPDFKYLFQETDFEEQKKKLMQVLGTVVGSLENLEPLVPTVQELGKKHVSYGVKDEDYPIVGQALLETLAAGLGEAFSESDKEAWVAAYGILTEVMTTAAAEVKDDSPISVRDKMLVQETWKMVVPIADTAADVFYGELFSIAPEFKPLFPDDMAEQKAKLLKTLGIAVSSLNDLETLVPILQELGKRHIDYKVEEAHYPIVGQALLATLAKGLGDAFTEEVKAAWTNTYTVIAQVMMEAAKSVEPEEEAGLTEADIQNVQESWAKVAPIASTAADLFYEKLFSLDPNLKPLFKNPMTEQKNKLMTTLGTAVAGLNNLEALIPVLQGLGKGHVAYGVEDKDYNTVGTALLDTLEKGLGEAFTPEVKTSWTKVYGVVSSVMMEAAASVPKPEPVLAEEPKGLFAKLFGIFK